MLQRFFLLCFALSWALLGAGCAESTPGKAPPHHPQVKWETALEPGVFAIPDKPLLLQHGAALFQVRYGASNALMVRNLRTGKETLASAGSPPDAQLRGIASYSDGKKMVVAWRPKLTREVEGFGAAGAKMVYVAVAASATGETFDAPSRVSNANGAFMPTLTGNGRGDVYVVWQDERSGSAYDLYFNVSHDQGKTWKEKDIRLDVGEAAESFSAEPSLRAEADWVWLAWNEASRKPGQAHHTLYVRASGDRGETWNAPVAVATPALPPFYPQLVRSRERLLVYWFDTEGVKGAGSADNGVTWSAIPPIKGAPSTEQLLVQQDGVGAVHLIYGGKGEGNDSRNSLYYTRSGDGVNFGPAVRLNSGDEFKASAIIPVMAFDSHDNVMAAWMDYRYFRPVVFGAYSGDQGKTWSRDFMLDDGPESGVSQLPTLLATGEKWWLSLIRYDTVTMAQGRAIVTQIKPEAAITSPLPGPVDQGKLEGRVKAWWDSRINRDWAASYDLMDPFMRARTKQDAYVATQGKVTYFAYEIVRTEMLEERKARVHLKFTSSVPELQIYGRVIEVPKKEEPTTQDWIWIDGNWYFLFKDLFGRDFLSL